MVEDGTSCKQKGLVMTCAIVMAVMGPARTFVVGSWNGSTDASCVVRLWGQKVKNLVPGRFHGKNARFTV